jgi:hypothetical protein
MRFSDIPVDLLPPGTERWEVDAADRMLRGDKLGPRARHSALRLLGRLQAEGRARRQENFDMREDFYRQQLERGARSDARHATPGARLSSASVHPAGGEASRTGGGAPSFDARHATDESFRSRVAGMGLDVGALPESRLQPPPRPLTAPQRVAARFAQVRANRERQRREEAITAGRIDGRNERPEAVVVRLAEFGIRDSTLNEGFRNPPPPPPPPEKQTDPRVAARAAEVDAEKWARGVVARGESVNAAELSEVAFRALLKARGLQLDGSGPGFNAPLPRR